MAKKSVKPKKGKLKEIKLIREYVDNSVLDFDFSDHVEVTSYQRGMLLSFGKANPQEGKTIITHQFLLPFDVAISMSKIITTQIDNLVEQKLISEDMKVTNDAENKE